MEEDLDGWARIYISRSSELVACATGREEADDSMQILCVHILMYTYKRVLLFGPEKNMIISKRNEKKMMHGSWA